MSYTRRSAWNNGGTFANSDLLWYAKGVGEMQKRALNDPNSWWFFAAIHGITAGWSNIQGPPNVPTSPRPDPNTQEKFWNQCQHGSWYFTPWHRGYLIALEAQIRTAISTMPGAPTDWALPYWDYFKNPNMPPAFGQKTLPDGKTPNPLYVTQRYGPERNPQKIYVPNSGISDSCQGLPEYTGSTQYGGKETKFEHGGRPHGMLESNPHDMVHYYVGGPNTNGLMGDPRYAALDPIFYLHHCYIDHMWASWNATGKKNPSDANWLSGPASQGDRPFLMPMPDGSTWNFTPGDLDSLSKVNYTYSDMSIVLSENTVAKRLEKLGVPSTTPAENMELETHGELVGSNDENLQLKDTGAKTTVKLDKSSWQSVPKSLMAVSSVNIPDRVYLTLENVKGNMDANMLSISINDHYAGKFALFGLRLASKDNEHGAGAGLSFVIDITDIIDDLHLAGGLDVEEFEVSVSSAHGIPPHKNISIGRVSVYRMKQ